MTLAPNLHTFLVLLDVALWFFDASYNNMTFYFPSLTPCMTKLLQPSVPFCVYTLWPCPDKICRHCSYPSPPPAPLWVGSWIFYLMCRRCPLLWVVFFSLIWRFCPLAVGGFVGFFTWCVDIVTLLWVVFFSLIWRHCPLAVVGYFTWSVDIVPLLWVGR